MKIERLLSSGRKSKFKFRKKIINWTIRHYYSCDIDCKTKIANSVKFAHNGLGVVINPFCIIEDNVSIFPGAKLVTTKGVDNAPIVKRNVIIGANATLIGKITIGENAIVGAGAVVSKNVPPNHTVIGINCIYPSKSETAIILHNLN